MVGMNAKSHHSLGIAVPWQRGRRCRGSGASDQRLSAPGLAPQVVANASISPADRRHSAAATLARTCSGALALAITEATIG